MLRFDDFFHLPLLDPLITQIIAERRRVTIVTGLASRVATSASSTGVLPSSRITMFRALVGEILAAWPDAYIAIVGQDRDTIRIPRSRQRRVTFLPVRPTQSYDTQIGQAVRRRADLVLIDQLDTSNVQAALEAGRQGRWVVTQLDTVFRGAEVARYLRDLGASTEDLEGLGWVITVQRTATLCPECRRPAPITPARFAEVERFLLRTELAVSLTQSEDVTDRFFEAPGCEHCNFTGRMGDIELFDIYRAPLDPEDAAARADGLPIDHYMWHLVEHGALSLDDLLYHDADRLHQTYRLLSVREQALASANAALQRKLAELAAANQVLEQRTAALISLHEVGQALVHSTDLTDLVGRVCRQACDLCGADRAILYYLRHPDQPAEVLAVSGWDAALLHQRLGALVVVCDHSDPAPFVDWPPGVPAQHPDVAGFALRAGLKVPLMAHDRQVGLMIVQSTQKARFRPGEVALLQTFAIQAALSIQRAELIDARIRQERTERELELAREVQQSVLPHIFPAVPGYTFAAQNQPARQVGGDFYDLFVLDEAHIGVVIADVSDKGMPAALYMALTRSLLLAEAQRARSPRTVLLSVNRLLRQLGDPHMFVTLFYGVIAVAARELTYARAGHDYPLLLRSGAASALGGVGTVLGCFDSDSLQLSEEQITLAPGDRLVLYTDGLTDVLAPDGRRLELERLKLVLCAHAERDPAGLCAATFADLAAFQGDVAQYDDMTMLVIGVE
jgi:sigma-B regulation protein RsbU (phosphoserine phosphatase)